jgi:uncharacterized protein YrzB (UPF0473 family)
MQEESITFVSAGANGEEVTYEVLVSFQLEETGKDYVVYTDGSQDEEGNTKIYASIWHPEMKDQKMEPIETDKEWEVIQTIIDEISASVQEEE